MDPAHLHTSTSPLTEDIKPMIHPSCDARDKNNQSDEDSHDEDPSQLNSNDPSKRPRLRLAHACDRCRKRKIRCDTHQPCAPCLAAKNECTFVTPSRRLSVKPKASSSGVGEDGRLTNLSGQKRPHSPGAGEGGQTDLEGRLAALEAMLGDVPPKVHNAFLASLDARLGSGTGVGIKEGKGEGVGVAFEALSGGNTFGGMANGSTSNGRQSLNGLNSMGEDRGRGDLVSDWSGLGGPSTGWQGVYGLSRRKEEEGVTEMAKRMEGMSFFYEDEIGQAKWQGATSGFPLLSLLTANTPRQETEEDGKLSSTFLEINGTPSAFSPIDIPSARRSSFQSSIGNPSASVNSHIPLTSPPQPDHPIQPKKERFFPDRTPRPHQTLNPEASWRVITGVIPPDLMDTLVRCYLSTSHLLWPFLHVPSFLNDYANPQQWGEPGFVCFIVAVCTLSSRHVDDPRVRANPQDPSTAGKLYFELFKRLRDLPSADRPTLYSIQAAFLAAVYAFGLGNLSKAFALQAESITLCLDGGLHRSVDGYDHFDAVEKETRKRTFWSIYSWDKQSAALFGRPPIIHLRDCDVTEPLIVDDENLTAEGVQVQSDEETSRMCAFVATIRLHVVLEGVIDSATQASSFPTSPFLAQAAAIIARPSPQNESLGEEEALLEEWKGILPKYWQYDDDTTDSRDPIRITQAERLHCLEHLVRMLIYRHRFSGFVAMPASTTDERARHLDLCRKAMQCALTIIADHVHISQRGMMTYYGVHVIHQLAQAGRTLVAVSLNCRTADFRPLIAPSIEGLRSCVGLLRRFSGRYLCGLRSADIIDEFCRICNIPVDSPRVPDGTGRPSPAWLRPVRKRASASPSTSRVNSTSPNAVFEAYSNQESAADPSTAQTLQPQAADLDAFFNTSDYIDLSAMSPGQPLSSTMPAFEQAVLGEPSSQYNKMETLMPGQPLGSSDFMDGIGGSNERMGSFDYTNGGSFGGEMLAGEGMDTVSDGLKGVDGQQGLSAATILSLLEEGSFDYGSIFTDQAPLHMEFDETEQSDAYV